MPRTKEDKYVYDKAYNQENVTRVTIVFNRRIAEDMMLMEWLKKQPEGRNGYMKRLMREDMKSRG